MANNIRGITVEIGGDTKKLNQALSETSKESKNIQTELKKVEKALKLDPSNTELLAQKQELLAQAADQARDRLSALLQAQEQMGRAFSANADWEAAYTPLKAEIDATSKALEKLTARETAARKQFEAGEIDEKAYSKIKTALGETEGKSKQLKQSLEELEAQFKDGHIDGKEYRQFQRDLAEAESSVESMQDKLEEGKDGFSNFGDAAKAAGDKVSKAADAVTPFSIAAGGVLTAAGAAVEKTEELRSDLSKLDNNARQAGIGVDAARQAFEAFCIVSDEVDSSVEATSNLLQAGFTESNLQKAMEGITGAYLAFPDTLKIESLADSLQETLATGTATGQFGELLDRLGVGAENFSENLALCTTEAQKQDLALSTLSGTGMMEYYQSWRQSNPELVASKEANQELKESLAALAEVVQPLATMVMRALSSVLGDLAKGFGGLDRETQTFIVSALLMTAAAAPVMKGIAGICHVLPTAINLFKALGVEGGIVVAAIGMLIILAVQVMDAWDDMSGLQKVVAVLGLVAAAALTAAVAVGAFQSAATLGLAAAGIAAGIITVAAVVKSATADAKNAVRDIPQYATGTDYHPGGLALVGEEGAELLSLPRGARVYSNRETAAMLNQPQREHMGGDLDTKELLKALSEGFSRVVSAVERKKTDIYLNKTRMAREISREQKWLSKTEGGSLVER